MKRTYIAPQSDIEIINLIGSIMDDNDPGFVGGSDTSDDVHSNVANFEEDMDLESTFNSKSSLWD